MVTVGAFSADEVEEDIEISFAALEHRFQIWKNAPAPTLSRLLSAAEPPRPFLLGTASQLVEKGISPSWGILPSSFVS